MEVGMCGWGATERWCQLRKSRGRGEGERMGQLGFELQLRSALSPPWSVRTRQGAVQCVR
ncbi:hypothetical protein GE21DRAFT_1008994 [Neurospora crassa]|nr:hypothetical protein GE21DRAFT_1008994 [Neurospora crassa]